MKRPLLTIIIVLLVIGSIPYFISLTSYSSSTGYIGNGIAYATSDKSHYQSFRIAYFENDLINRVRAKKGDFYIDGQLINNDSQSFFIHKDKTTQLIEFSVNDYEVSKDFSSGIYGIFGPVPHFKDYQIDAPKNEIRTKLPKPTQTK